MPFYNYAELTDQHMENDKHKNSIREPFPPENTPVPPQNMDPNLEQDRKNKNKASENQPSGKDEQKSKTPAGNEKPKLLGESETEITDETTI
jgi:hypothetical protein